MDTHNPNPAVGPPKPLSQPSLGHGHFVLCPGAIGEHWSFQRENRNQPCFLLGLSSPGDTWLRNDSFPQKTWGKMIIVDPYWGLILRLMLHMYLISTGYSCFTCNSLSYKVGAINSSIIQSQKARQKGKLPRIWELVSGRIRTEIPAVSSSRATVIPYFKVLSSLLEGWAGKSSRPSTNRGKNPGMWPSCCLLFRAKL